MKFILSILFFTPAIALCQFSPTQNKLLTTKINSAKKAINQSITKLSTTVKSTTTKQTSQEKMIAALTKQIRNLEDSIRNFRKVFVGSDFTVDRRTGIIMISPTGIARIKAELK